MAKVRAAVRNKLPDSAFADPKRRKFLIHDKTHAELAWRMLDRASWPSADAKSSAKSRILKALSRFNVDTSNYEAHSMDFKNMQVDELSVLGSMLSHDLMEECSCDEHLMSMKQSLTEMGYDCESEDDDEEEEEDMEQRDNFLKIPVARLGSWYHPVYGVVKFSQRDFDDMQRNFERDELGFPPYMRYGHDIGNDPNVVDAAPSRGTIVSLFQEGEVLYSLVAASDTQAYSDVKEKRMRFASAELMRNAESKHTGENIGTVIKAISLTNAPFIPNLPNSEALSTNSDPLTTPGYFVLNMSQPSYVAAQAPMDKTEAMLTKLEKLYENFVALFNRAEPKQEVSEAVVVEAPTVEEIVAVEDAPTTAIVASATEEVSTSTASEDEQIVQPSDALSVDSSLEEQESAAMNEDTTQETQQEDVTPPASEDNTQDLSQDVAALRAELEALKAAKAAEEEAKAALALELSTAKAAAEEAARAAELYSNALANEKLEKQRAALIAEGIPPAMVEQAFSLAAALPVNELKLSDGATVSVTDKLAELLRSLPNENRVQFGQVGQNLSTGAAEGPNPYADIIERYKGEAAKSGK